MQVIVSRRFLDGFQFLAKKTLHTGIYCTARMHFPSWAQTLLTRSPKNASQQTVALITSWRCGYHFPPPACRAGNYTTLLYLPLCHSIYRNYPKRRYVLSPPPDEYKSVPKVHTYIGRASWSMVFDTRRNQHARRAREKNGRDVRQNKENTKTFDTPAFPKRPKATNNHVTGPASVFCHRMLLKKLAPPSMPRFL